LIFFVVFFLLFLIVILLLYSPIFAAGTIKIEGNNYLSRQKILNIANLSTTTPLFDINSADMQSLLLEDPWITSAAVDVVWPSEVVIKLSEAKPIGFAELSSGNYVLVGSNGKLLNRLSVRPDSLEFVFPLSFVKPGGYLAPASLAALKSEVEIILQAPESVIGKIKSVNYTDASGDELLLQKGIRVVFGNSSQVTEKWAALATMMARTNINNDKEIDLQDPNLPVVTG